MFSGKLSFSISQENDGGLLFSHAMDSAVPFEHQDLAIRIFAESGGLDEDSRLFLGVRGRSLWAGVKEFVRLHLAVVRHPQRPYFPDDKVAIDISPFEFWKLVSPINEATRDTETFPVVVFKNRVDELGRFWRSIRAEKEWTSTLAEAPAVVATVLDPIDLLPQILPDIRTLETTLFINTQPPWIPDAARVDLGQRVHTVRIWVVSRDAVGVVKLA